MTSPPPDYLAEVIALCRAHGVLSIVDEIQTGLGRTGALFACETAGETPDMLLLAKALGGGLMPIGACIARPDAWDEQFGLLHSSTFANGNLAACAAHAVLDRLERDDRAVIRHVAEDGAYLNARLLALREAHPEVIREVRGRGFMAGLEFHRLDLQDESAALAFCSLNRGVTPLFSSYLFNVHGVLTAPLFNESHVMRLQPPFTVGRAEIDRMAEALDALCEAVAQRDVGTLVAHLIAPERARPPVRPRPVPRKAATPSAWPGGPRPFAFLLHYTQEDDLVRSDPSLGGLDPAGRAAWRDWVRQLGPGFVRRLPAVRSATGAETEGWIMSVPLLPADMAGTGRPAARDAIARAVDLAAASGIGRFGLGAFTSIVTRGGETAAGRGVPVTSGNTLTTVLAVQALERMTRRVGLDLSQARVAVVGATGAIGRLAALSLSRRAGAVMLVGNPANPYSPQLLRKVANEICALHRGNGPARSGNWPGTLGARLAAARSGPGASLSALIERSHPAGEAPVACTTDLGAALGWADVALVATSADLAFIDPARLRPGMVVCDVARPPNVAAADMSASGALVFDGGLVQPPTPVDLGPFQTLPAGMCWGCLGETMLLALEGAAEDFSLGGALSLEEADRIEAMAARHGFAPAAPQWHGALLGEADCARVARHVPRRVQLRGDFWDRLHAAE